MRRGTHGTKRNWSDPLDRVQAQNRTWWESTPMAYDWLAAGSTRPDAAWFTAQDQLSIEAHRFFATTQIPYDRVIPFSELAGKNVLEIGVGSGLHSELMARAGATVWGIDLTDSAVALTRHRFDGKQLGGRFDVWDAEQPRAEFDGRFDFIWSWGVIHHSSRTARIVRNVARWLTDGGRFAGMVYHRDSTSAAVSLIVDGVCRLRLLSQSVDETLWRGTDGFSARFYPAEQWRDLLLGFFEDASVRVSGQDADAVPLPRWLRRPIIARLSHERIARILARVGGFVIFDAGRPLRS